MNNTVIAIIDDNIDFTSTLRDVIEKRGYRIISESNCDSVGNLFNRGISPSVIVIDYSLVEERLISISSEVRRRCPDCLVVLTTGRVEMRNLVRKLLNMGIIDYYLQKPYSTKSLLQLMERRPKKRAKSA